MLGINFWRNEESSKITLKKTTATTLVFRIFLHTSLLGLAFTSDVMKSQNVGIKMNISSFSFCFLANNPIIFLGAVSSIAKFFQFFPPIFYTLKVLYLTRVLNSGIQLFASNYER